MVMNDVSARRRCCAEAQARGVRWGGAPPGKIDDFTATVFTFRPIPAETQEQALQHHLMGKRMKPLPRRNLPLRVFLLTSCSFIPAGRCRQGTPRRQRRQRRHDGVSHGSRAIHRGQGASVNPFGVTPLSLTYRPHFVPIRGRGDIHVKM